MNDALRWLMPPLAVVLMVTGCASPSTESSPVQDQDPAPTPPSASTQIHVLFTGVSTDNLRGLDYEALVEFGDPIAEGGECDLAAPQDTATVPVTLTLVNTLDPEAVDQATADDHDNESVSWSVPRKLTAEPVGGAGPLRWAPKRPGYPCTDQPDVESMVSLAWEYREQAVMTGYLTGVPEQDPTGAGVRLEFTRELWDVQEGEPEPLTVVY